MIHDEAVGISTRVPVHEDLLRDQGLVLGGGDAEVLLHLGPELGIVDLHGDAGDVARLHGVEISLDLDRARRDRRRQGHALPAPLLPRRIRRPDVASSEAPLRLVLVEVGILVLAARVRDRGVDAPLFQVFRVDRDVILEGISRGPGLPHVHGHVVGFLLEHVLGVQIQDEVDVPMLEEGIVQVDRGHALGVVAHAVVPGRQISHELEGMLDRHAVVQADHLRLLGARWSRRAASCARARPSAR